jgi:NAD dependent epimerase/dehydratase family enzyme
VLGFIVTVYKGIYRPSYVHEHSEESTDYGDDFQGQMWSAAEAAGRIPDGHPTRQVTIRAGWVLGTGVQYCQGKKKTHTHFLSDLTHGLQAGLFEFSRFWFGKHIGPKFGDGSQPFPWIHLDDLLGIRICGYVTTHARTRRRTILLDTKVTFALENPSVRGVLNAVAPQIITNDEYAQVCTHPFSEKKKKKLMRTRTHTHTPHTDMYAPG